MTKEEIEKYSTNLKVFFIIEEEHTYYKHLVVNDNKKYFVYKNQEDELIEIAIKSSKQLNPIILEEFIKIPESNHYCYDHGDGTCPYWGLNENQEEQNNGFCKLLKINDWESDDSFPMLFDAIKECGLYKTSVNKTVYNLLKHLKKKNFLDQLKD